MEKESEVKALPTAKVCTYVFIVHKYYFKTSTTDNKKKKSSYFLYASKSFDLNLDDKTFFFFSEFRSAFE